MSETQPETVAPRPDIRPFANRINEISTDMPWRWLVAGWQDLKQCWPVSVPYAAIFVALGYLITGGVYQAGLSYLIWPLACGFVLIAPVFCLGFYALSRAVGRGEKPAWSYIVLGWRTNTMTLLGTGLGFLFFVIIWLRVAALIYVLFFPNAVPTIQSIANQTFFSAHGLIFLATGTLAGAVFAIVTFLFSAVSLQNMMNGGGFVPSILMSMFSVSYNFLPMMIWAAIIVVTIAAGMAPAFLGLIVTLPLIGHASWHAYRDVIRGEPIADDI